MRFVRIVTAEGMYGMKDSSQKKVDWLIQDIACDVMDKRISLLFSLRSMKSPDKQLLLMSVWSEEHGPLYRTITPFFCQSPKEDKLLFHYLLELIVQ